MKLKKGDKVKVMVGKDRGRQGVIEKVYQKDESVLLMGINVYKKHVKKSEQMPKGGIVDVPRPLNVAKVMFICPKCNKPTRIGYKRQNEKKVRFCKRCESIL